MAARKRSPIRLIISNSIMLNMEDKYTEYERATHRGRKICEREELGDGYCGSCDLETHALQLRNPQSWVHSIKGEWLRRSGVILSDNV